LHIIEIRHARDKRTAMTGLLLTLAARLNDGK